MHILYRIIEGLDETICVSKGFSPLPGTWSVPKKNVSSFLYILYINCPGGLHRKFFWLAGIYSVCSGLLLDVWLPAAFFRKQWLHLSAHPAPG